MNSEREKLKKELVSAQKRISQLNQELEETHRGLISLTMELEEAKEKYKNIFDNAIEGIFQLNTSGQEFLLVNPAMAEILGYASPDEILEKVDNLSKQVFVNPDHFQVVFNKLKKMRNR